MKDGQKLWTRDELVLAINLYCKLPFGKMHSTNPEVIKLATLIDRTPSSVARKLSNLASFDPALKQRGIIGSTNASKLDKQIWDEFYNNWDAALLASEQLLADMKHTTIEELNQVEEPTVFKEGLDKERIVKTRVNQSIFRNIVLATYNYTCCITGINNPELLIASHIAPWSQDRHNRLNPMNGLCLNALHDRAFDAGLITIDADDYTLRVSSQLKVKNMSDSMHQNFVSLEGRAIVLPGKFLPSKELLKVHNEGFRI